MMPKNIVAAIPMQIFNTTTLNGTWQTFAVPALPQPCFMIRIINNSASLIQVSYDGVTTHDIVLPADGLQINFQLNSRVSNHVALMATGTVIYIKSAAANPGQIYLCGYYQPQIA
jgi:hypothetical protein